MRGIKRFLEGCSFNDVMLIVTYTRRGLPAPIAIVDKFRNAYKSGKREWEKSFIDANIILKNGPKISFQGRWGDDEKQMKTTLWNL